MQLLPRVFRIAAIAAATIMQAQPAASMPALKVSDNQRFLVTEEGTPFFYLADTAWELFHRLNREQAVQYLEVRAKQRFNVIQAVALAELQGLDDPNPYGHLPLVDRDPARPAVTPGRDPNDVGAYDYWDHVDFIVNEANRRGIYIGFLPTWGAWAPSARTRPEPDIVFTVENARVYGEFLGRRYGGQGVLWILGGDRVVTGHEAIWRSMAAGIAVGAHGREDFTGLVMTFHPHGFGTSSTSFHNDHWLTFNMQQTAHNPQPTEPGTRTTWQQIADDYERTPVKPVIDGEPLYEDHPIGHRSEKEHGYSFDAHVRQRAYWHVFAGSFGHAYGHHSVWQMYSPERRPVNGPVLHWYEAIHRPGATQMQHLRALIESRPFLARVPDQSLVVDALSGPDHIASTRGEDYAFIYSGRGRAFTARLGKISGTHVTAWSFNPRNGFAEKIGTFENAGTREFVPHVRGGLGTDTVIVLDDASKSFPPPGSSK
jgi:hypothetical protein